MAQGFTNGHVKYRPEPVPVPSTNWGLARKSVWAIDLTNNLKFRDRLKHNLDWFRDCLRNRPRHCLRNRRGYSFRHRFGNWLRNWGWYRLRYWARNRFGYRARHRWRRRNFRQPRFGTGNLRAWKRSRVGKNHVTFLLS